MQSFCIVFLSCLTRYISVQTEGQFVATMYINVLMQYHFDC